MIILPKSLFKHYRNYICAVYWCKAEKFFTVTPCGQIYKMICINFLLTHSCPELNFEIITFTVFTKPPLKSDSLLFTLTLRFEHNLVYQKQFMMAAIFKSVRLSCFQTSWQIVWRRGQVGTLSTKLRGIARSESDGTRWRTGGEVKGKDVNGVGSQQPRTGRRSTVYTIAVRWSALLDCQ